MINTKADADGAMRNALSNYVLGLVFITHCDDLNWATIGKTTLIAMSPSLKTECSLAPLLSGISSLKNERPIAVREFQGMLRRAAVGESHELLVAYCESTNQFTKYRSVPWFQFARIARNTVSHKQGGIVCWPDDLRKAGLKEVFWRHRVIRESDHGNEFQITDAEILQLFGDMLGFLERELT